MDNLGITPMVKTYTSFNPMILRSFRRMKTIRIKASAPIFNVFIFATYLCFQMVCPLKSHSSSRYATVQEGLRAAHATSDKKTRSEIYREISQIPTQSSADVQAVYQEMTNAEHEAQRRPSLAHDPAAASDMLDNMHSLSGTLSKAVSPEVHAQVAKLLDEERSLLPGFYAGAREETSQEQYLKAIPKEERLRALMDAAGNGKNRSALPVLRKISQRKDYAGSLAVRALSHIGEQQDLDTFINEIKTDPKARLDLTGYGPKLTDRILTEINNSGISRDVRRRLAGYLAQAGDPEGIPKYVPLLKDNDRVVAHIAARAIAQNVSPKDSQPLQDLLKEPDAEIRVEALSLLDNRGWDPAWSSTLIEILQKDQSDSCRMMAAHLLGKYKVQKAERALENAKNDQSMLVRGAAETALKTLFK